MNKDTKNRIIPGFKVMEWLRATRDELSLQYLAMTPEERRANFSKERCILQQNRPEEQVNLV